MVGNGIKADLIDPMEESKSEGRMVTLEFDRFILVSVYTPHSGVGELKRLEYRVETWDRQFQQYLIDLKKRCKPIVVCGDLNVIRHDSDIYNPAWVKEGRPGLTDRERKSFESILEHAKLDDTFRKLYPLRLLVYSHWTDRNPIARKNNWGTRMDYFLTSKKMAACLVNQKYNA
jgi:exodeoxyribonuclease-3